MIKSTKLSEGVLIKSMVLYDRIGGSYDRSRCADLYISKRLFDNLRVIPESRYLDLACGTGNYTIALRRLGVNICGIDNSRRMLDLAYLKDSSVEWFLGDVEALPFSDGSFSGVTCILAIHHFGNLQHVFNEASRVMSRGRFVIFTATSEQMEGYWLNEYFPKAMKQSIDQMPSKDELTEAFKNAGFDEIQLEPYEIKHDLQDYFLYSGKYRPEIYLDPVLRMSMSTFAALAESREVEEGCNLLEADIHSGRIYQVIDSYDVKEEGDYLFITGNKSGNITRFTKV